MPLEMDSGARWRGLSGLAVLTVLALTALGGAASTGAHGLLLGLPKALVLVMAAGFAVLAARLGGIAAFGASLGLAVPLVLFVAPRLPGVAALTDK